MQNMFKLQCALMLIICATSCTYVYYPTYPVVPDAEDKGFGVQGTLGLTKAQLSAWYAMDSNIYFTGTLGGAISALGDADSNSTKSYGSKTFTIGVGYNFLLSDKAEFNIQGGVGLSQGYFRTNAFNPLDANQVFGKSVNTQSTRIYLQPSFKVDRGNGGFYIIPRVTYESFTSVKPKFGNAKMDNRSFLITEVFLMGRFKTKVINIDLYGGVAGNLMAGSNINYEDTWVAQPFVLGFGLSKTFGQ